ncbi:MAG TPA: branched-chain amino acid ABC transporter permease [Candidatus Acidoferrales bacterium]|nr:branched-chain amino acid ABC transporter permease [Candidatus Acidoferrales bacterium]
MSPRSVPLESGRRLRRILLLAFVLGAVLVVLAPLANGPLEDNGYDPLVNKLQLRILTYVAMFIVLAAGWNIIGGLAGYAAFGNVAFFGLGAYATGALIAQQHVPFAFALLAAPLAPAAFAALIGIPLLRLRGHYFAVSTLGVSVAVGEVVKNIDFLGGSTGLFLPILRRSDLLFYYLMVGAAALAIGVTWLILHTRFGYGLLAIRENEEAAAVIGVPTTAYKVAAFVIAAALSGLAGGVFAQWNSFINQENVFPIEVNVQMILMAVLGGAGTLFGPVAGAIALELLIQGLAGRGEVAVYAQMGLGVLLAATVLFIPRGVVDFFGGRSRLNLGHFRRSLRETSI